MSYLIPIKYAILIFPVVAFLFTLPFIISQYHKFGSVSLFKSIVIYLFVFYLISAYFLVILPLPKISEVAKLTTPRVQLVPFKFISDFIRESSFKIGDITTYLKVIKESSFYVPLFNVFLTMPFGLMLRYYFKFNLKQTCLYTFFLSLFFELTQLSGLYFLYPRGYRLFDVDDLILNTLGGLIGYGCLQPVKKIIPGIDEVNKNALEKGRVISGFRRSVAAFLDGVIVLIIEGGMVLIFRDTFLLNVVVLIVYYMGVPFVLGGSTIGERFLNIQIRDYNNEINYGRLFWRKMLFMIIYIGGPLGLIYVMENVRSNGMLELGGLVLLMGYFLLYGVSLIKYIFTSKDLFYEKISKTRRVSTLNF